MYKVDEVLAMQKADAREAQSEKHYLYVMEGPDWDGHDEEEDEQECGVEFVVVKKLVCHNPITQG